MKRFFLFIIFIGAAAALFWGLNHYAQKRRNPRPASTPAAIAKQTAPEIPISAKPDKIKQERLPARILPQPNAPLFIRGGRTMYFPGKDRANVMLILNNTQDTPIRIFGIQLDGTNIAAVAKPADDDKRQMGVLLDWYHIRPADIPANQSSVFMLGGATTELLNNLKMIQLQTDGGRIELPFSLPDDPSLKVATAAFSDSLRSLILMIRNDSLQPARLDAIEFNAQPVSSSVFGKTIRPGMSAYVTVDLPQPPQFGEDCSVFIQAGELETAAWFRAHPAESMTYPHAGNFADKRELLEKNMSVHATRAEGFGHLGREFQKNSMALPPDKEASVRRRAQDFGERDDAWAWYMEDDAGWGNPTPMASLMASDFIRNNGSRNLQFLCNPADNQRYAWTHDMYMNYAYYTTGQAEDPTIWRGGRSLDFIRDINEPAPILYLVDCVGQYESRWITRAEEELASFAMIGRGAKQFGWFLIPSHWEQGYNRGGGIDPVETKPYRYQEGATATPQIWNHIGHIAAPIKALGPWLATGSKLPSVLDERRIETLPVLCKDNLIITTILNRHLRSLYPYDFGDTGRPGYTMLQPWRNILVEHALPRWIKPVAVYAYDIDRGLRQIPYATSGHSIQLYLDALDTAGLLLICPDEDLRLEIENTLAAAVEPAVGGSCIHPSAVVPLQAVSAVPWMFPETTYRLTASVKGPVPENGWVKITLPAEPQTRDQRPLGFFDPTSVKAVHQHTELSPHVDYYRLLATPEQQQYAWKISSHSNVTMQMTTEGLEITGSLPEGRYHSFSLIKDLLPEYDILEIASRINGSFAMLLNYTVTVNGEAKNRPHLISDLLSQHMIMKNELPPVDEGDLIFSRINWHQVARLHEKERAGKNEDSERNWEAEHRATLSAQARNGTYTFGLMRQCKSSPDVFVRVPNAIAPGHTENIDVYWDYTPLPLKRTPEFEQKPVRFATASAGPVEPFSISELEIERTDSALRIPKLEVQAAASSVWVDMRDRLGSLLLGTNLTKQTETVWFLPGTVPVPPHTEDIHLFVANQAGHVIDVPLSEPEPLRPLKKIITLAGQIETMDCTPNGKILTAGAKQIYTFSSDGKALWSYNAGVNTRQKRQFGKGNNIDHIEVSPDGSSIVAFMYHRENDKVQEYSRCRALLLNIRGEELETIPCDPLASIRDRHYGLAEVPPVRFTDNGAVRAIVLKDGRSTEIEYNPLTRAISPAQHPTVQKNGFVVLGETNGWRLEHKYVNADGLTLIHPDGAKTELKTAAYRHITRLLPDGKVLIATTQGDIQLFAQDGSVIWQGDLPSRIDDMVVLPSRNQLAIAYKQYPHRWGWQNDPILEIRSVNDGAVVERRRAERNHDYGHYGMDLVLCKDAADKTIFMGTPMGSVFRHDLP